MALLSVTIDLDEIHCYHAIHGLGDPTPEASSVVYSRALPRVARFLKELQVPGTFFAVGRDLEREEAAASNLRQLAAEGQEIANHTMNHRYDFSVLGLMEQAAEIDRAAEVIGREIGQIPKGFRAPGYNIHLGITDLLENRGYSYDSSVFPCPAYYSAKAAAIGIKKFQGRTSASLIGDPRVLSAPTTPYRVGQDGIWTRGEGMAELPITVVTPARLPFIGTSIAMMGALPASLLARSASRLPFVNLELHGIDFIDADGDGLGYLKEHQPDLRIPLIKRRESIARAVKTLLDAGLEPVTLSGAAERVFLPSA